MLISQEYTPNFLISFWWCPGLQIAFFFLPTGICSLLFVWRSVGCARGRLCKVMGPQRRLGQRRIRLLGRRSIITHSLWRVKQKLEPGYMDDNQSMWWGLMENCQVFTFNISVPQKKKKILHDRFLNLDDLMEVISHNVFTYIWMRDNLRGNTSSDFTLQRNYTQMSH